MTEPLITPVVCSADMLEVFIDDINIAKIAKLGSLLVYLCKSFKASWSSGNIKNKFYY